MKDIEEFAADMTNEPRPGSYWTSIGESYTTHWPVAAVHRDSDVLGRSNWQAYRARMVDFEEDYSWGEDAQPDVYVEPASHWAVGWLDTLFVAVYDMHGEITPAFRKAYDLLDALEAYPVLDETLYSEMESQELDDVLINCYDVTVEELDKVRCALWDMGACNADDISDEMVNEAREATNA